MRSETIELAASAPGVRHHLQVLRFGTPGRGPKATVQAALHADEVPAVLVAHALRRRLAALEAAGRIEGEVQLVPYANPLGMGQQLLGHHHGRFDLRDGVNFNRNHVDLVPATLARLAGRIGPDAAANMAAIRAALRESAAALVASAPTQDLKHKLLALAIDSDVVLDLHCDGEAAVHLYALAAHEARAAELGALLGARAVLLADESGDSPFDEACSRPWLLLRDHFQGLPVPLACFSATVELRGEADTSHALADQDAAAIVAFLARCGVVAEAPASLPAPLCRPTPLAGSEPVLASRAGVVVFHRAPGDEVVAGTLIADIVDAASGDIEPVRAASAGVLYARSATRWALPGARLAKIAGTALVRTGRLLSP